MGRKAQRRLVLWLVVPVAPVFILVALLGGQSAFASDLDLLTPGSGGGSSASPPPNVLMVFDDTASMNNLVCARVRKAGDTDSTICDAATLTARTVGSGISVCESPALRAVLGMDKNGATSTYVAPYEATGVTFGEFHYSIYSDPDFVSGSVYSQVLDSPFAEAEAAGTHDTLADVIARACDMTDCFKKSRCIFSLRTQGYFWEPATSSCGTGDPMAMCTGSGCGNHTCDTGETACSCATDCLTSFCGDGCCYAAGGENSLTCAGDCGAGSCGDSLCGPDEDPCTCAADCGAGSCGDGVCCTATGESSCTCAADCGASSCGDGTCCAAGGEDRCSCAVDCGASSCGDGVCCAAAGEDKCTCGVDCGGSCGDGMCCPASGENRCTCASDCGASSCGDGVCCASASETIASCSADCQPPARTLGAACADASDCNSGFCTSSKCSSCKNNGDCPNPQKCLATGCTYSRCGSATCNPGGGGWGGGWGGGGMLDLALDLSSQCVPALTKRTPSRAPAVTPAAVYGPLYLGDFLNFYPPKSISLLKVFLETVSEMKVDVRLGLSAIRSGSVVDIKPTCHQVSGPRWDACTNPNDDDPCMRGEHANFEVGVSHLDFTGSDKPLAQGLDLQVVDVFTTTIAGKLGFCSYDDSVTTCAQNGYALLITDGAPVNDATSGDDLTAWARSKDSSIADGDAEDNDELLDEVAKLHAQFDHRTALGTDASHVVTYTVSYGKADPNNPRKCTGLLEVTAAKAGGKCFPATRASELKQTLLTILIEIAQRARGFTSPAVPTTRYSGTSSLSNAMFRPSTQFPLWEGHIFGFAVCDELLGRLTSSPCSCFSGTDANEVCVKSADDLAISYDDEGNLAVAPFWDAALCLAGDFDNTVGVVPPDQSDLDVQGCKKLASARVITTAAAATAGAALSTSDQLDFLTGNATSTASALSLAMNVGGASDAERVTNTQQIISFYRGVDSFNADGDSGTDAYTEDRNLSTFTNSSGEVADGWWKLGDIFHSTPAIVAKPDGAGLGGWASSLSYKKFAEHYAGRPKVMLVGANDGMVHAFNIGTWDGSLAGGRGDYDQGTGEELWAFVSPEMLPKLKTLCNAATGGCQLTDHVFLVDGSVMAREVWVDESGTADKQDEDNWDKWHTIAIYGHRDGGRTYVALDVTDIENPVFLWQFPQPNDARFTDVFASCTGSPTQQCAGNSWLDTYPAGASVGPMKLGSPAAEKWVALLSGGYDPLDIKGRAVYVIDAYDGGLLVELKKTAGGATANMNYSFPATPVFYADMGVAAPYIRGFVAADHGGQLWHFKVQDDGTIAAQLFFQAGDNPPIAPNTSSTLAAANYQRWPFFFAPSLTRHNGGIRVIIGTGDRDYMVPVDRLPVGVKGVDGYVCDDQQRIYAIDVGSCGTSPCREGDLVEITDDGTYASTDARGWFYKLPAGEKAATPFDIFHGYAFYSTFSPTYACGTSGGSCAAEAKGQAYLHVRHYISGKPYDWNGDGDLTDDTSRALGDGVPRPPAITTGVSNAGANSTILSGPDTGGPASLSLSGMGAELTVELMRLPVSREMHQVLH